MVKRLFQMTTLGFLALGMAFGVSTSASADSILEGYDLFHTPGTLLLDLGPLGSVYFESNPGA